ncbi:Bug family tripartite tricarboxylate transporter substrate binding protein [Bordetella sp. 02P26C-1]|uniref:Bug family tripartite tricarboxylate transporter substrate binding protein n=1 Tax=Bordetella sp. 02P26C-1 TaxID=2683195 RepID=UPI00135402E8|nr:tripartite tricarboxylate transporter substrate binding protein [Bordetella sp. 02P26C-1]MVW80497.1 tripartite tricarboxylate transporter substrate binding protein [Bordetella sp. 02P26C-1]
MFSKLRRYKELVLALSLGLSAAGAHAAPVDNYPAAPINMIVGWAAGGPADGVARMVAAEMSKHLGQSIVVDNKAGAGGNIGSVAAARANPDGYTIMLSTVASHGLNSALYDNIGYDPIKDFAPVGLINTSPSTMLVPADSPFKSVKDYVDHAKANPGKLTYASGGVGSSQHLAGASFKTRTGIDILHVPFKSTAPALTDVMAGRVDMIITTGAMAPIASGKVRPLAITSKARIDALPEVPTFDEAGVPGFYMDSAYGLVAPAGTPRPILIKLNEALAKALQSPELREKFIAAGSVPAEPISIDAYWDMVQKGMGEAAELVRISGAKKE